MHFIDTVKNALLGLNKNPVESSVGPQLIYPKNLNIGIRETPLTKNLVRIDSYYDGQLTGHAIIKVTVDAAGESKTSIHSHSELNSTSWELLTYIQQR